MGIPKVKLVSNFSNIPKLTSALNFVLKTLIQNSPHKFFLVYSKFFRISLFQNTSAIYLKNRKI